MSLIQADFSKISSSSEPLPDGEYRMRLEEIEDQSADEQVAAEKAAAGKQCALVFKSVVTEGEHVDRQVWDFVYLQTNEGKPNKMGLGRVKAYAEALLGAEAANNPAGIDTDDLPIGGEFIGFMKTKIQKNKETGEKEPRSQLAKLLPVG